MRTLNQFFYLLVVTILSLLVSCKAKKESRQEVNKTSENPSYQNPVLDRNFPDPTAVKAADGYYYVYGTNSVVEGNTIHMQVARSTNLVNWEFLGDALPERPAWANSDFWAPHVFYDKDTSRYFLFYSGESVDENLGKCLGVAVSKSPEGPFRDKSEALLCGLSFINIDPMLLQDPVSQKKFLYWGSGHEPIMVQEMADDLLDFKKGTEAKEVIFPVMDDSPENYSRLVEGPWVHYFDDYYYLFYSGDNCCGEQAHYALMVARSRNPTGPFTKLEQAREKNHNSVILQASSEWKAPGHNSLIRDEKGDLWTLYHAISKDQPEMGRMMLLDRITFKDGWPVIENQQPSSSLMPAPTGP